MSVKFKKLALAAAVGTLGFAGMAQADSSLLFPYVTTASTAYTFVSVFHDPDPVGAAGVGFTQTHYDVDMHLYYGYKPVGASATTGCTHLDFDVQISEGALLQFEVANKVNLPKEFGDLAQGYGEELTYSNNIVPANVEGFLIVEYASAGSDIINGEAAVVDTATGLATSYTAEWSSTAAQADFTGYGDDEHVTSWYPRNVVTTAWYALPTGTRSAMTPNASGGISASIRPVTNIANIGAYGRQEVYTSGSKVNSLKCFGTFGIDSLLNAQFKEGGWMSIQSATDSTFAVPQDILLYKTQTTTALGKSVSFIQREQYRF